jgi:molecular chaperone GrpE
VRKRNTGNIEDHPENGAGPDGADASAPSAVEEPERALEEARREAEELRDKNLRLLADYQNSQRRAISNEQEARRQGVAAVAQSMIGAIDHFDLALAQDLSKATPEQIVAGMRVIRDELLRAMSQHGLAIVHPQPGEAFDPSMHEALMRQPSHEIVPGAVIQTLQAGYRMGERLVRPAKVIVSMEPDASAGGA